MYEVRRFPSRFVVFSRCWKFVRDRLSCIGRWMWAGGCGRLYTFSTEEEANAIPLTFLLVDPDDDHRLRLPHLDELVDGADPPAGQLREEDHPLDVVVLEEGDVRAHVRQVPHFHHHHVLDLRVDLGVEAAEQRHLVWSFPVALNS